MKQKHPRPLWFFESLTAPVERQDALDAIQSRYRPDPIIDSILQRTMHEMNSLPESTEALEEKVMGAKEKLNREWPEPIEFEGVVYGWLDTFLFDILEVRLLYGVAGRYNHSLPEEKQEGVEQINPEKYLKLMKYCYERISSIADNPSVNYAVEIPKPHVELARVYFLLEEYDKALKEASLGVHSDPLNPGAHMVLAEIQAQIGEKEKALEQLQDALRLDKRLKPLVAKITAEYHLLQNTT